MKRSNLIMLALFLIGAGFLGYLLMQPVPIGFTQPAPGTLHLRPFQGEAWIAREFPASEWRVASFEAALKDGTLHLELADRETRLFHAAAATGPASVVLAVGYRKLQGAALLAREDLPETERARLEALPEADRAEVVRYAWRVVTSLRSALGESAHREVNSALFPPAHTPSPRMGVSSGGLAITNEAGYATYGEPGAREPLRVIVQDWISVGRMFKTFEKHFRHLPDEVEVDGRSRSVGEYESPLWRVVLTWSP